MIDKALYELLEPGVRAMGYELVTVEMTGRGRSSLLRVYIDSPQGITVDDCASVSGQVSAILDVEDPIPDHYTLEVSSPGMDRPLCKLDHFRAVIGQRIKIRTSSPVRNRRGFTGTLAGVAQEGVSLDVDGERYDIPMSVIVRARLIPDFGAAGSGLKN